MMRTRKTRTKSPDSNYVTPPPSSAFDRKPTKKRSGNMGLIAIIGVLVILMVVLGTVNTGSKNKEIYGNKRLKHPDAKKGPVKQQKNDAIVVETKDEEVKSASEHDMEVNGDGVDVEVDAGDGDGDGDVGGEDNRVYHLVFSTDCSPYQHWQSYLLFHSAMKVKQPGYVTRIVSGCQEKEEAETIAWHKKHVQSTMSDKFQIHMTPHFSAVKDENGKVKGDYKFFNKPFGLRHWMEHGEGMGVDEKTGKMFNEDMIIILTDPDMVLMRPITADFSNSREVIVGKSNPQRFFTVEHGQPIAQKYGFGSQWYTKLDFDVIAGENSPAKKVNTREAFTNYPVGPPYLATARDMYNISVKWSDFAPGVHKQYPYLLAEMFAFCAAAAHLELPHQLMESLMVSNVGTPGEGWDFINNIPKDEVCSFAKAPDHEKYAVPSVLHYCQRYIIGPWFWAKRRMPHNIFTCDAPLLKEPDTSLMEYNYFITPDGQRQDLKERFWAGNAFMVCALIEALNEAGTFFKKNSCEKGNYSKTHTFVQESVNVDRN